MKNLCLAGGLLALCLSHSAMSNTMKITTFSVWPGGEAPGAAHSPATFQLIERHTHPTLPDRAVTGIRAPEITVYRPDKANGIGLLVAPGGAYSRVVLDKEGSDLAPVFNAKGYTLFVMTYRMPDGGHQEGADAPLADAQRAMRVVRARASEWGVDPDRVGMLGFSAGGHVAASLATRYDETRYSPLDNADTLSAKPAFVALLYPVISMDKAIAHPGSRTALTGKDPDPAALQRYSMEKRVTDSTPPVFLVHAADDPSVPVENSLVMFQALRAHHVPVEMHIFEHGKHGFGIRGAAGLPASAWPELLMNWITALPFS